MPHDAASLSKLLRYEPETGKLFWRKRPLSMFPSEQPGRSWNTRWAGREALTARDSGGYHQGRVNGEYWQAHRVAWTIYYGTCPKYIDHINGDPADNRIDNLRGATRSENGCNQRIRNRRPDTMGVTFEARRGQWRAHIGLNGKFRHIGYFDTAEAATEARREAEKRLGFDPHHGLQAGGRRP